MKKIIFLIIIVILGVWALQTYTEFKALDYLKGYWQKIDWTAVSGLLNKQAVPDPEKQLNVFIRDGKFLPSLSAAKVGIKVTWFNEDSAAHTVTGEGWGSAEIAAGKAYSKTFDVAGDYQYHCSSHPSETGEIIVK